MSEPITAPPPATNSGADGTAYVVLEKRNLSQTSDQPAQIVWAEVGTHTTAIKDNAIKEVVGERGGTFKAVPLRNWKGGLKLTAEKVVSIKAEAVDV